MGVGVFVAVDEGDASVFGSEPDVLGAVVVHQAIVADDVVRSRECEYSGCQGSQSYKLQQLQCVLEPACVLVVGPSSAGGDAVV